MDSCTHDETAHQFRINRDHHQVGLIDYQLHDGVATFTHTETDPSLQGQGLAGQLTRYALEQLRELGWKLVPQCPYTRRFVHENIEEYGDLLA